MKKERIIHMITRDNYELFALDYLEGTLPKEDKVKMESFLLLNPDIASEIESLLPLPILKSSEEKGLYSDKSKLYKKTIFKKQYYIFILLALFIASLYFLRRLTLEENLPINSSKNSTYAKIKNTETSNKEDITTHIPISQSPFTSKASTNKRTSISKQESPATNIRTVTTDMSVIEKSRESSSHIAPLSYKDEMEQQKITRTEAQKFPSRDKVYCSNIPSMSYQTISSKNQQNKIDKLSIKRPSLASYDEMYNKSKNSFGTLLRANKNILHSFLMKIAIALVPEYTFDKKKKNIHSLASNVLKKIDITTLGESLTPEIIELPILKNNKQ